MINKIIQNNICSGCGLCQGVFGKEKISVQLTEDGYYRPFSVKGIDEKEELLLSKFCPALIDEKTKENAPYQDHLWGEMYSCSVGFSADKEIRKEASSGGCITALLNYLLSSKKVVAVVHIGASNETPYLNEIKISTTREELIQNANSRYSPSAPLLNIIEIAQKYDSIAFVGKPCDVAALRQLSHYNELIRDRVQYYISFFCAGIPSLNATKGIIAAMDVDLNNVKGLFYRKDGWPGFFKITDNVNRDYKLSYVVTWMSLLAPYIQFRCKICADAIGHQADIVCADAWEDFDGKGFPTFKDAPGKSLIISRTLKGEQLFKEVVKNESLKIDRDIVDFRELDKIQPGQFTKKVYFLPRKLALLIRQRLVPKFSSDFYFLATLKAQPISFLRNLLGTLKRTR